MALATRPKPSVSHKKRRAQHHRHNRPYLQTYWPYLPLFAIVGAGAIVNKLWSAGVLPGIGTESTIAPSLTATEPVTRIQAVAGSHASTALAVVIVITGIAFAVFIFRHWRRLNRLIGKGEAFVYRHAWFDMVTVLVITVGALLTRPDNFIR